ncbi:MAG: hypothetical protein AAF975_02365 [Spirochaetota bacterium]
MSIQTLTRAAQVAYAETLGSERGPEIDQVLFPAVDISPAAEIELDQYLHGAAVMRVRTSGSPANTREIQAGTRTTHTPPIHGEKVMIDETLRDQAIAGVPASNWQATMEARVNRIIGGPDGFVESWLMARRHAAVQYLETGKIALHDFAAQSYEEFDFGRAADNAFNWDFSTSGNNFDGAVKKAYEAARTAYCPTDGLCLLLGRKWQERFDTEAEVIKKREATQATELVQLNMQPPRLQNVEGLSIIARYRVAGVSLPFWVLTYEPMLPFKRSPEAAPTSYVGDDKLLFFSLKSGGYRFYRGVDYLDGAQNIQRAAGGLVIDSFTEKDPIAEVIRAQSRFFYMPSNVDHTVCVSGSNF